MKKLSRKAIRELSEEVEFLGNKLAFLHATGMADDRAEQWRVELNDKRLRLMGALNA